MSFKVRLIKYIIYINSTSAELNGNKYFAKCIFNMLA